MCITHNCVIMLVTECKMLDTFILFLNVKKHNTILGHGLRLNGASCGVKCGCGMSWTHEGK